MQIKQIYIASDGKEFETEDECKEHDKITTPPKIRHTTYIHADKWSVHEELTDAGYVFEESILGNIKYILNEVKVEIEIDTKTGEYKILSFD